VATLTHPTEGHHAGTARLSINFLQKTTRKILDRETYQPRWSKNLDMGLDLDSGTLDPSPDPDTHQNVTDRSLGRAYRPSKEFLQNPSDRS